MQITPVDAISRNLTWKDFKKVKKPAPAAGQSVTAARTHTKIGYAGIKFDAIKDSDGKFIVPKTYQLTDKATVTVKFQTVGSWVATFVLKWPQNLQDDLLGHEQIHYMISALTARDFFEALKVLAKNTYDSSKEGSAAVKELANKMLPNQDIQDKYDLDTKHLPTQNAAIQAKWTTCVVGCRTTGAPLRAALTAAALFP